MGKTVRKGFGVSLWRREFLPHIIVERPLGIGEECKENGFIRADDQFFIMNNSVALGNFHLYIGLVLFLVALFLFGEGTNTEITLSASSFLIGSFYIIYNFTHPKKILILDRLNGIITFPGFLYGKAITMPFDEVLVAVKGGYGVGMATLAILRKNKLTSTSYDFDLQYEPLKSWSFMVWYMDKNRPLPPGEIFDPYRQKDYERRKKEGFPKPLYQSWIATPENP
ncbi:hypothetical protein [Capnocytophaga genosp. AHN8471]|uniref:hypothetical protein n=1 Tax=Capnocytophaga genosp. AHN8471 TaxID=327574 RepID=UPI001932BD45|nr:hypothetical protein [Capnocytophaga genosp. AHN8471]MBM0660429.1 hypothetical protein [Capnocytophaga genosp. AHN8471]